MKKSILNICIIFMISLLSVCTPEMKSQNPEWMYFHDILDPDEITAIDNSIYLTEDYNRVIRINLENLEIDTIAHISAVSGIVQDKEKNIWMSTRFNGIYKYSNGNLENFTSSNSGLPDSRVYDLAVDNNNNIWYGARQELAKYDGTDWEVYHFEYLEPNGYIYSLAIDKDGTVWVMYAFSPYKIAKFYNGEFIPYNGENTGITSINWSSDIDIDSKGNKWFLAGNLYSDSLGGLIKYDGNTWSKYDKHNSAIADHQFGAIAIDSNDIIWTGSYYSGLYRFDGENWTNLNSSNSGLTADDVRFISVDKYNNKWIININEAAGNEYVLEVYNEGGVLLPSNVEEVLRKKSEIAPRIYPNPATDEILITVPYNQKEIYQLNIFNQIGEKILSQDINTNTESSNIRINVSDISNGLYRVAIYSKGIVVYSENIAITR